MKLTETQKQILDFIKESCHQSGIPPSYREIQKHFKYKAVGTVQDHVRALVKKGALEQNLSPQKRRARNLLPVGHRPQNARVVPIYGEIAAGAARDTNQLELGELLVSQEMAEDPSFALRVVGHSMMDVGIFEGDTLVVDRKVPIKSGDIVVALLDGETTVKRYVKKAAKTFLVPENKQMKPIEILDQDFQIQGKVVGVYRKL